MVPVFVMLLLLTSVCCEAQDSTWDPISRFHQASKTICDFFAGLSPHWSWENWLSFSELRYEKEGLKITRNVNGYGAKEVNVTVFADSVLIQGSHRNTKQGNNSYTDQRSQFNIKYTVGKNVELVDTTAEIDRDGVLTIKAPYVAQGAEPKPIGPKGQKIPIKEEIKPAKVESKE